MYKLVWKASEREIKVSFGMQTELGEEKLSLGFRLACSLTQLCQYKYIY